MSLQALPTLDELADHPERGSTLSPEALRTLMARAISAQQACLVGLAGGAAPAIGGQNSVTGAPEAEAPVLLTAQEAAKLLRISVSTLYRAPATYEQFAVTVGHRKMYLYKRLCQHLEAGSRTGTTDPPPRAQGRRHRRPASLPPWVIGQEGDNGR